MSETSDTIVSAMKNAIESTDGAYTALASENLEEALRRMGLAIETRLDREIAMRSISADDATHRHAAEMLGQLVGQNIATRVIVPRTEHLDTEDEARTTITEIGAALSAMTDTELDRMLAPALATVIEDMMPAGSYRSTNKNITSRAIMEAIAKHPDTGIFGPMTANSLENSLDRLGPAVGSRVDAAVIAQQTKGTPLDATARAGLATDIGTILGNRIIEKVVRPKATEMRSVQQTDDALTAIDTALVAMTDEELDVLVNNDIANLITATPMTRSNLLAPEHRVVPPYLGTGIEDRLKHTIEMHSGMGIYGPMVLHSLETELHTMSDKLEDMLRVELQAEGAAGRQYEQNARDKIMNSIGKNMGEELIEYIFSSNGPGIGNLQDVPDIQTANTLIESARTNLPRINEDSLYSQVDYAISQATPIAPPWQSRPYNSGGHGGK